MISSVIFTLTDIDTLASRFDVCQYVSMTSSETPAPTTELCCGPLAGHGLSSEEATELAAVLKALADPVRLRLISLIASAPTGEVCACDLPGLLDRTQPTTSHHLSQLVKAGFLEREQRGKWAWFRIRSERLAAVCAILCGPA